MKLAFEAEDAIIGIACGLLLLGLTGRFFSLKLNDWAYVIAFIALIISIFLDVINEFSDLSTHFGLIMLALLHNLVDLAISLAFISHFTKWNIPYITQYLVPYLHNESIVAGIGIFLVVSNAIWLLTMPFWY
ncbi:hypothetical protein HYX04_04480 [Candidatus Woesearchaeota archaeon]|nr:hypothetical protein [Candidatus Woesearchaeota archaeon]